MVDSTNLPEVDINQIATDLNGKMDRDCLNASDTGNIQIAHNAMPSNKYINLTPGASGSTYIAPADGFFVCDLVNNSSCEIYVGKLHTTSVVGGSNYSGVFAPVSKGAEVLVYYSQTPRVFCFIYAIGSESEAS